MVSKINVIDMGCSVTFDYFPTVSELQCPFCGRYLLYDPRIRQKTQPIEEAFANWVFADIATRYDFLYDTDLVTCPDHGPCHEACDVKDHPS